MGWIKRPPRSPKRLTSQHLDEVLIPDDYQQPFASQATKARGYPWEGLAGRLEVREWTADSLICVYITWSGGIAKRAFYNGTWRPWLDAMGKAVP